jgi:hypothetical protein
MFIQYQPFIELVKRIVHLNQMTNRKTQLLFSYFALIIIKKHKKYEL